MDKFYVMQKVKQKEFNKECFMKILLETFRPHLMRLIRFQFKTPQWALTAELDLWAELVRLMRITMKAIMLKKSLNSRKMVIKKLTFTSCYSLVREVVTDVLSFSPSLRSSNSMVWLLREIKFSHRKQLGRKEVVVGCRISNIP